MEEGDGSRRIDQVNQIHVYCTYYLSRTIKPDLPRKIFGRRTRRHTPIFVGIGVTPTTRHNVCHDLILFSLVPYILLNSSTNATRNESLTRSRASLFHPKILHRRRNSLVAGLLESYSKPSYFSKNSLKNLLFVIRVSSIRWKECRQILPWLR
jgi:hypothetical protein